MTLLRSSGRVLFILFVATLFMASSQPLAASHERLERPRLKKIVIGKRDGDEPKIFIIDQRAWDVYKCQMRFAANKNDGDALFIVANYHIFKNELTQAESLFINGENAQFVTFTRIDLTDGLAYIYYHLKNKAREDDDYDSYCSLLSREQQLLLPLMRSKNSDVKSHFSYLYALSFVDFGLYLEEIEKHGNDISQPLPATIISSSRQAFEMAHKVLTQFTTFATSISTTRALVYEKLDSLDKATQERRLQGINTKQLLYEKQRGPLRTLLLNRFAVQQILNDDLYTKLRSLYYRKFQIFADHSPALDSLIGQMARSSAEALVHSDNTSQALAAENISLLITEVSDTIRQRLNTTFGEIEKVLLLEYARSGLSSGLFEITLQMLKKYEPSFENSSLADSLHLLRRELLDSMQSKQRQKAIVRREIEPTISMPVERPVKNENLTLPMQGSKKAPEKPLKKKEPVVAEKREKPIAKSDKTEIKTVVVAEKTAKKTKPKDEKVVEKAADGAPEKIPQHIVNVGTLIDGLIEKKDYVGAYRGMKAYEKVLKGHFGSQEIDKNIRGLEQIIAKEFGDKYLTKLKKEVK